MSLHSGRVLSMGDISGQTARLMKAPLGGSSNMYFPDARVDFGYTDGNIVMGSGQINIGGGARQPATRAGRDKPVPVRKMTPTRPRDPIVTKATESMRRGPPTVQDLSLREYRRRSQHRIRERRGQPSGRTYLPARKPFIVDPLRRGRGRVRPVTPRSAMEIDEPSPPPQFPMDVDPPSPSPPDPFAQYAPVPQTVSDAIVELNILLAKGHDEEAANLKSNAEAIQRMSIGIGKSRISADLVKRTIKLLARRRSTQLAPSAPAPQGVPLARSPRARLSDAGLERAAAAMRESLRITPDSEGAGLLGELEAVKSESLAEQKTRLRPELVRRAKAYLRKKAEAKRRRAGLFARKPWRRPAFRGPPPRGPPGPPPGRGPGGGGDPRGGAGGAIVIPSARVATWEGLSAEEQAKVEERWRAEEEVRQRAAMAELRGQIDVIQRERQAAVDSATAIRGGQHQLEQRLADAQAATGAAMTQAQGTAGELQAAEAAGKRAADELEKLTAAHKQAIETIRGRESVERLGDIGRAIQERFVYESKPLRVQLAEAQAEQQRLKDQIGGVQQAQGASSRRIKALQQQQALLRRQLATESDKLKESVAQIDRTEAAEQSARLELAEATKEIQILSKGGSDALRKLTALRAEATAQVTADRARANEAFAEMKAQSQAALEVQKEETARLTVQLEGASNQAVEITTKYEALQVQNQSIVEKQKQAGADAISLHEQLKEAKARRDETARQLKLFQTHQYRVPGRDPQVIGNFQNLTRVLENNETYMETLDKARKKALAELKATVEELAQASSQLSTAQVAKTASDRQLAAAADEANRAIVEKDRQLADLTREFDESKGEIGELQEELRSQAAGSAEAATLREEITEAKQKLQRIQAIAGQSEADKQHLMEIFRGVEKRFKKPRQEMVIMPPQVSGRRKKRKISYGPVVYVDALPGSGAAKLYGSDDDILRYMQSELGQMGLLQFPRRTESQGIEPQEIEPRGTLPSRPFGSPLPRLEYQPASAFSGAQRKTFPLRVVRQPAQAIKSGPPSASGTSSGMEITAFSEEEEEQQVYGTPPFGAAPSPDDPMYLETYYDPRTGARRYSNTAYSRAVRTGPLNQKSVGYRRQPRPPLPYSREIRYQAPVPIHERHFPSSRWKQETSFSSSYSTH